MKAHFPEFHRTVTKEVIARICIAIENYLDFSQRKSEDLTHGPKLVYVRSLFKSQDGRPNFDSDLNKLNTFVP